MPESIPQAVTLAGAHLARTLPEISATLALLAVDNAATNRDVGWASCGFLVIAGASGCNQHGLECCSGRSGRRFESCHSDQSFQRVVGGSMPRTVTLWHATGTHWRAKFETKRRAGEFEVGTTRSQVEYAAHLMELATEGSQSV